MTRLGRTLRATTHVFAALDFGLDWRAFDRTSGGYQPPYTD